MFFTYFLLLISIRTDVSFDILNIYYLLIFRRFMLVRLVFKMLVFWYCSFQNREMDGQKMPKGPFSEKLHHSFIWWSKLDKHAVPYVSPYQFPIEKNCSWFFTGSSVCWQGSIEDSTHMNTCTMYQQKWHAKRKTDQFLLYKHSLKSEL